MPNSRRIDPALASSLSDAEFDHELLHVSGRAECQRMRRLKARGIVCSPVRGFYARCEWYGRLSPEECVNLRAKALHLLHPDWVFCGFTAGVIHGVTVPRDKLERIHVLVDPRRRSRNTDEVVQHAYGLATRTLVKSLPVTSLEETCFDCVRALDFRNGLAVCDSALRMSNLDGSAFAERVLVRASQGKAGAERVRKALRFMDARSESGGESIARAMMIELGFQLPDLQVVIPDPIERRRRYRVDFLWELADGSLVAGEFDGREKYANSTMTGGRRPIDVLADERIRESRLGATGLRVMRLSYKDLMDDRRFTRILEAYGIPRCPAVP